MIFTTRTVCTESHVTKSLTLHVAPQQMSYESVSIWCFLSFHPFRGRAFRMTCG